jgi:hypothetical protein
MTTPAFTAAANITVIVATRHPKPPFDFEESVRTAAISADAIGNVDIGLELYRAVELRTCICELNGEAV